MQSFCSATYCSVLLPSLPGRQLTGAVLGLRGRGYGFDYDLFTGWSLAQPEGFSGAKASIGFQLSYQFNSYTAQF